MRIDIVRFGNSGEISVLCSDERSNRVILDLQFTQAEAKLFSGALRCVAERLDMARTVTTEQKNPLED